MDADPHGPSGGDWAQVGDVVPLAFAGVTAILLLPLPKPLSLLPLLQPGPVLGVAALDLLALAADKDGAAVGRREDADDEETGVVPRLTRRLPPAVPVDLGVASTLSAIAPWMPMLLLVLLLPLALFLVRLAASCCRARARREPVFTDTIVGPGAVRVGDLARAVVAAVPGARAAALPDKDDDRFETPRPRICPWFG